MWNVLGKILQLAVLADIEYANAKAGGVATLLQPGNFEATIAGIAQIFAPPVVTTQAPVVVGTTAAAGTSVVTAAGTAATAAVE